MNPMEQFSTPPLPNEHRSAFEEAPGHRLASGLDEIPRSTGWRLVLGVDANGNEVAVDGVLMPPNKVRRALRRLLIGERWERT